MTTTATPGTETDPAADPETPPADPAGDEPVQTIDQLRAEAEKWKAESRKQEQRAKANAAKAKKLDEVEAANLSETERAVAAARDEARREGLREGSARVVRAEIRAAAAGRPVDVDALLEGIDANRFIDDDGDVDTAAIAAWIDKLAPAGEQRQRTPDLGQGARSGPTPGSGPAADFGAFITDAMKR